MWVERKESKKGETYWKTTALLDDGTEATGFGKEFKEKDEVEVFLDTKWDTIKMQHSGTHGLRPRGKHEKKEERQTEG